MEAIWLGLAGLVVWSIAADWIERLEKRIERLEQKQPKEPRTVVQVKPGVYRYSDEVKP